MSDGGLSIELFERDVEEAAKTFDIVQSNEFVLLLDLDNNQAMEQYERVLPKVERDFGITNTETWASKSGNVHVRLTLKEALPFPARVALQAAMGSDGVKEALTVKRWRNGCYEPSVLFRPRT